MALVNLDKRITDNWDIRCKNLKSPDSYIYVKNRALEEIVNPASMEIDVGDVYIIPGDNKQYKIPKEGLNIKPKESIIIYSKQKIALPYNIFGIVTGKGNFIFQGCFISTGKIDPGFDGYLKIGFYNGGKRSVLLEKNKGFASVYFLNSEFTMDHSLENYQNAPPVNPQPISKYTVCINYIKSHILSFVAWLILAIPAAVYYILEISKLIKQ